MTQMRAAIFNGPYSIETISKEVPSLKLPTDALVKVKYSGLCGSDLHYYRGHIPLEKGTTMGHEFVGTIVEKGSDILDLEFEVGDIVVSTFTIQCGECYYCKLGNSGTCEKTNTFGKPGLEGGQAEYVLVPFARSTLFKLDSDAITFVLMADIFVTAFFGVQKILRQFRGIADPSNISVLQIGAGPVGLCSVRILKWYGFSSIVVVDSIDDRLKHAIKLGATALVNFTAEPDKLTALISSDLESRGFDAVLECVGASSAMDTAFKSVRKGGFIASVGMGHDQLPFDALQAYVKGVTISFGRCNAWSLFQDALDVFKQIKNDFNDFIEVVALIEDASECYKKFDEGKVKKVVFQF
ncbi:hypothetical protein PUMCH_004506 [Australozyma saopauloensis]|uniref:Alcohol dehydrogenase n=1 Tax=Australozyma saopauloensis TaxID=291208 RepID=A0AAX4HFH6_9ASCO|nr:hypothetical protein PUMCH_004506 [[Candida] saopauloensis]